MPPLSLLRNSKMPHLLLAFCIITYTLYFSGYTINRHNTLNSYAADLSLIDQPMWNTTLGPGSFMELTWGNRQQPRLAEHFEPVLIPLAWLFFLWDDVRILLIAQSLALALGALPVFWIAQHQFSNFKSQTANWAGLAFAAVYLLFPHLQAANIADFHADPFVVTPLLFAFWYATQQRWGWMWVWAIVAMSTKETLPTLTAMLGIWLPMRTWQTKTSPTDGQTPITNSRRNKFRSPGKLLPNHNSIFLKLTTTRPELPQGLLLILISVIWFLVATFLIVAPLARQYFGSDGPIYLANRYPGGLLDLPQLLQDPARWQYLLGLFAAVGFLPLLAPELLILGLPVLAANLLSNFPGQYSGEQHYSAPLVVAFVLAAIYGVRRSVDHTSLHEKNRQPNKKTTLIALLLWLLTWSLAYHALHGWTPLSTRTETYQMTPAAAYLPEFIHQVPPNAIVAASAAVHPHLAHRRIIYIFPTMQEADYMLVDVTDIPGVHPNDAHAKIIELLTTDWQLLQAHHGLLLTQKSLSPPPPPPCASTLPLPCNFYDFVRATTSPPHPTTLVFGDGRLRLLGYDIHDDPDDGVTFRFYWHTSEPLPKDLHLWPLIYDDVGQLLSDPTQVPMIATIWYPPSVWQPSEIIVTETLPQLLPDTFHLGLAVGLSNNFQNPAQRPTITTNSGQAVRLHPGHWAQLATFERQGPFLTHLSPALTLQPLISVEAQFGPSIHLTGFWFDSANPHPGATLPILLKWTADQPLPADYTVFIHLLASDGTLVAQHDGYPTWLTPQPTSQWSPNQPILDQHTISLPDDLPSDIYTLQVGLYDAQTMARIPLPDGHNALPLTQLEVK